MSPTIKEINIGGYRFYFTSTEGGVMHVHIDTPSGTILWWLGKDGPREVTLKKDYGVKTSDKNKSKRYVNDHYDTIVEAWNSHFSPKKSTSTTQSDTFVYSTENNGFWLYVNHALFWVGFDQYPVFRYATDAELVDYDYNKQAQAFHWPALDVDISFETLRHPDKYPLRARHEREHDGSPITR